jgi:hypothetical protein
MSVSLLGAGADSEEMREASQAWATYSLADNEPGDQLSLGPTVSVVIPTLNEVENLVFVCNAVPARVEVVEVKGRSGDDFMRVAKVPGPDVRIIFEPPRGKGIALGPVLHSIRLIVLEKLRGYDVAPA